MGAQFNLLPTAWLLSDILLHKVDGSVRFGGKKAGVQVLQLEACTGDPYVVFMARFS